MNNLSNQYFLGDTGGLEARVMITKQLQWDDKGSPPGRAVKENDSDIYHQQTALIDY